jgi:hypothetical protein
MSLMARVRSTETVSMETWFSTKKTAQKFAVEFKEGIPFNEFRRAMEVLLEERGRFLNPMTYFRKPSNVYHRRSKKTIQVTEYNCRYFISTNDELCYTQTARTGLYVSYMDWQSIDRIEMVNREHPEEISKKEDRKEKQWNRINKARYDEQTWSNLDKDSFPDGGDRFFYISKIFDESIIKRIVEAFEKKEEFRFTRSRTKRDFSVSGRMCENGIYKTWFSSEYSGCGNGDYYLLLNPRVAVFYQKD